MASRASHVSHAWHDIPTLAGDGDSPADSQSLIFNAVVEIPRGSKVKYELDKVSARQWSRIDQPRRGVGGVDGRMRGAGGTRDLGIPETFFSVPRARAVAAPLPLSFLRGTGPALRRLITCWEAPQGRHTPGAPAWWVGGAAAGLPTRRLVPERRQSPLARGPLVSLARCWPLPARPRRAAWPQLALTRTGTTCPLDWRASWGDGLGTAAPGAPPQWAPFAGLAKAGPN